MLPVYLFIPLSFFFIYLLYRIYKLLKRNKNEYIAYVKAKDSYLQGVLSSFIGYFFICMIFGSTFINETLEDLPASPMAVGELGKYIGILFIYIIFAPIFLLISSAFCMILYRALKCKKSQKSCFSIFIISLSCIFLLFLLCLY